MIFKDCIERIKKTEKLGSSPWEIYDDFILVTKKMLYKYIGEKGIVLNEDMDDICSNVFLSYSEKKIKKKYYMKNVITSINFLILKELHASKNKILNDRSITIPELEFESETEDIFSEYPMYIKKTPQGQVLILTNHFNKIMSHKTVSEKEIINYFCNKKNSKINKQVEFLNKKQYREFIKSELINFQMYSDYTYVIYVSDNGIEFAIKFDNRIYHVSNNIFFGKLLETVELIYR